MKFVVLNLILTLSFFAQAQESMVIWGEPVDPNAQRLGSWPTQKTPLPEKEWRQDLADQLRRTPGLQVRSDLSGSAPLFSLRGSVSNGRVLGLWDGIPLNFADGFGTNALLLPKEATESIQLIKGPSSLFYGSDALGGAINFVPSRSQKSSLSVSAGSFEQQSLLAISPFGKSNDRHFQISGLYDFTKGNYPYRNDRLSSSGVRDFNNRTTHRLSFLGRHRGEAGKFSEHLIWANQSGTSPGSLTSPSINDYTSMGFLGSAQWAPLLGENFLAHFRASSAFYEYKSFTRPASTLYLTQSYRTLLTAQLTQNLNEESGITYFLDYNVNQYRSQALEDKIYTSLDPEVGVVYHGPAFIDWMIQPGIRVLPKDNRVIPALGLFQNIPGGTRWVSISEGFRKPTLAQKFANTNDLEGNPNLNPETSSQLELGFEKQHNELISYGFTAYQITYDNLITSRFNGSKTTYINTQNARAYGGDLALLANVEKWVGKVGLSFLKTEDQFRDPLPMSPDMQISISVKRSIGLVNIEVIDTYWTSYYDKDFSTNQLVALGPWNNVDLLLTSNDTGPWSYSVGIINLFDTPREFTLDYPEPQRRIYLNLARQF